MIETQASPLFNKAAYDDLKRAQRLINDRISILDKASDCGIECQDFRTMAKSVLDRLMMIEKHFFSPPPTS